MAEEKKLPKTAYVLKEGETFVPYTHGQTLTEFSAKSIITGIVLGIVFGAANTYLGLVAGLTISTSIPVAVLSVMAFRAFNSFGAKHTILETNMAQTIGSASSSVASGVLFTLPALFLWAREADMTPPGLLRLTFLGMAGGLLGVLAMVPLRRYLIKKEHGRLPYPEGMACAEVQVAAEQGGKQAVNVFWGIGFGMAVKFITDGLKLIPKTFELALPFKAKIAAKVSPALIGVGYILGLRVGTIMVAGSALSALVIIPIIGVWGADLTEPFYPEVSLLIRDMDHGQIWNRYVRYIGAGAVACGGIITLIQSIPAMVESFKVGIAQLKGKKGERAAIDRTDTDLPLNIVGMLVAAILVFLTLVPGILGYIDSIITRGVASIMIAIFAFFFVTVSSRIVGLVGVTSNPTSGMTIATLIGTSLVFYAFGWTDMMGKMTALMVGTVVCIAASIAGDTSQDLKTGYVLGATPQKQQVGELVGVICSAMFVCFTLIILDKGQTLGSEDLPAPQATLMKLVIDGVLDQALPWNLVFIGMGISLIVFACRLPALPFAVGVYLPMSTMAPVFLGGLLRHLVTRKQEEQESERRREQGVLFGSGLVGGEGLVGVFIALLVVILGKDALALKIPWPPVLSILLPALGILGIMFIIRWSAKRRL